MLADLAEWLRKESQYVRLRAAATGKTLEETLRVVGPVLDEEARKRFPSIHALRVMEARIFVDRDLPDLSYQMIQEMRIAIASGGIPPIGPVPPPPSSPPLSPAAPAMAVPKIDDDVWFVASKIA
jgi:hypothetical protein